MSNIAYSRRTAPGEPGPSGVINANRIAHGETAPNTTLTDALGAIVAYFPTEINTTYTAVIAALAVTTSTSKAGQWVAFWFFLAATPIFTWLVYAARVRQSGVGLPVNPRSWPVLEMSISTITFVVWAGALPGSPLQEIKNYSSALAGIMVVVVTAALGLVAPVLGRPIKINP
jgi:RsiW-degrading membrane proteinase PrsW (M82 family)